MRLLVLICGLMISAVQAQNNPTTFTDDRDGNSYPIVEIMGQQWLGADLQYISPKAHFQDQKAAAQGNFYLWEEAEQACPEGWQLPTQEDWANFIIHYLQNKIATDPAAFAQVEDLAINSVGRTGLVFKQGSSYGFFGEQSPLNLQPAGRVEAGILTPSQNLVDYWVKPLSEKFLYYHIHLQKQSLQGHSHKHHVHLKSKKRRQFKIRCVKE